MGIVPDTAGVFCLTTIIYFIFAERLHLLELASRVFFSHINMYLSFIPGRIMTTRGKWVPRFICNFLFSCQGYRKHIYSYMKEMKFG